MVDNRIEFLRKGDVKGGLNVDSDNHEMTFHSKGSNRSAMSMRREELKISVLTPKGGIVN